MTEWRLHIARDTVGIGNTVNNDLSVRVSPSST